MKKFLAMLLALCLVLGSLSFAAADTITVNWDSDEIVARRQALGMDGSFRTLNAYPIQYWIPEELHYIDPTETESAASVCAKYVNEDDSFGFGIFYYATTDYTSITALADSVRAQSDFENVTELVVNGLDVISYRKVNSTNIYAAILTPESAVLLFQFYGVNTDAQSLEAGVICCSIQKAQESNDAAVNWSDYDNARAQMGISYSFVRLNVASYQFAIPEDMHYEAPTEEQQQANYVAMFANEAGDRSLAVGYAPAYGNTAENYLALLQSLDYINAYQYYVVNGIPSVYYTRSDMTNKLFATFFVGDDAYLSMEFIGVQDSTYFTMAKIMLGSVMAAQ